MIVIEGLSEIPGESQRNRSESPGETRRAPQGVPNVPLSGSATGTCRAGTSAHSVNLCGVPVELPVLYEKSCFFAVHPPHNLGRGYVGVSRIFSGRVLGPKLVGHIGKPNVSGIASGTFGGSVYTLRTFPLSG